MSEPDHASRSTACEVEAEPGETIWQVADRQGIEIPHLCWLPEPGYRADGNCRACMVEIEGERVLAASCIRKPAPGMKVATASERAKTARRMVFELLVGRPAGARRSRTTRIRGSGTGPTGWRSSDSRFPQHAPAGARPQPSGDGGEARRLHPVQSLRARLPRGPGQRRDRHGRPRPPRKDRVRLRRPDGQQHLRRLRRMRAGLPDRRADAGDPGRRRTASTPTRPTARSTASAPIAASAARSPIKSRTTRSSLVAGSDGPANQNRLCVKGRFGFDYAHHPHRLTEPLIRKDGVAKTPTTDIDPANPWTHFREASWEEALDLAAAGLQADPRPRRRQALAGFGSAKGSNEEAYLFQKLVRTGFGTNNVDHCTRLCHASSVAALMEGIGSGAVTAPFTAALDADVIIVIGANPTENHPVAATFFKQAAKRGAKLIVMDPRGQALVPPRRRTMLQLQAGHATWRMLNAMMHVIVEEGLYDRQYIQAHTEGFERLREHIARLHAGGDGADLRHRRRDPARGRAHLRPRRAGDHLLGHGHLAARARHRQCALPDLAGDDDRPGRPARHRPAPAARPEQRPGRLRCRADSDGVSRLPVGREPADPREVRELCGRRRSTPSAG